MTFQNRSILFFAGGFVLLNLIGLDRSSIVWIDEVVVNDPAKELARHGVLRSSVFSGFDGFDHTYLWLPPVHPLIIALVYKLFGFGIWQTRVPVVLFGGCAIVILYFIARHLLHSHRAAIFSAIVFALNPQFIHTIRSGRMDTLCLLFSFMAIFFFIHSAGNRNRTIHVLLSGLLVGLAGMTHPIAIMWVIAIGALILFSRENRKPFHLVMFFFSAMIPVAAWLSYALRFPDFFRQQFLSVIMGHTAQGSSISRFVDEFVRYSRLYVFAPAVIAAFAAGLIWFLFRYKTFSSEQFMSITLFSVPFFFVTFFMIKGAGSEFYVLHPVAILTIMIGAMFDRLLPDSIHRIMNIRQLAFVFFAGTLILNLVVAGIGGRYVILAYQWRERNYSIIEDNLRAFIPHGSVVFGAPEAWYAIEHAGSSLRVRGTPDPNIHDFVVTKARDTVAVLPGFRKIVEIGKPFPPVLGRYALSRADYQMVLWEANRRFTTGRQLTLSNDR